MPLGRRASFAAAAAVVATLALANVSALPVYRLYLLKDGAGGQFADGNLDRYDPLHPNFPNLTKAPSVKVVFPVASGVVPVQFLTSANETHPERIKGPLIIVPYPGPSVIKSGNLTVTLVEVPAGYDPVDTTFLPLPLPIPQPIPDPVLPPPAGPAALRALASVSIALDANLSNAPDPTQFVPPGSPDPADPAGYATAVATYEVAQLYPVILKAAKAYIVNVDLTVNATSRLALVFTLTQGDSPLPIPVGAFGTIEYDSLFTLSYLFIPWYEKDKPGSVPTKTPTKSGGVTVSRSPGASGTTPSTSIGYSGTSNGSPDAGLLLLPALGAVAMLLRRRLHK